MYAFNLNVGKFPKIKSSLRQGLSSSCTLLKNKLNIHLKYLHELCEKEIGIILACMLQSYIFFYYKLNSISYVKNFKNDMIHLCNIF